MTANRKLRTSIVAVAGAALALARSLSASATTVDAMPELRNSPKIATPERVKADPFGGTASYAYRFDVPPGTAGLTPELVLTYNTQNKGSEYGYGWSLNIPYIERSTRKHGPFYGDPAANDGEEFELEGELLARDTSPGANPDPGSARFYRRFADGSRILYRGTGSDNYWEVTRPDGTQLFFGQGANARMHRNGDTPEETFRWSLSEVRDLRGNSYRISYFDDVDHAGQTNEITYKTYIYPQRITYSHHPSAPASQQRRMVELRWGERANRPSGTANGICDGSEDCPTSYRAGFKVQQRYRLSDVVAGVDGNGDNTLDVNEQVRRYAISYGGARFSQIGSIRRYGKNDAAFPSATEFTYASSAAKFEDQASDGWALPTNVESQKGLIWDSPAVNGSTWFVTRMVIDMNGDGFPDRVRVDGTPGSHHWSVHLGSPTGFDVTAQTWAIDCGSGPAQMCGAAHTEYLQYYTAGAQKTDLVDMDGDGLPDRVRATEGSEPEGLAVYHNNGSGFDAVQIWTSPEWNSTSGFDGTRFTNATNLYKNYPTMMSLLADLNGDGRPDYISNVSHGYENTGAGFGKFLTLVNSNFAMGEGFNAYLDPSGTPQNQLIDVNGDGLPDFIKIRVCTAPEWVDFGLNLGTGGTDQFDWQRSDGQGHAYRPTSLDAVLCSQPPAAYPGGSVSVNPNGDRPETHYTNTWLIDVSLIDVDGDGIRDLVRMRRTEPKADVFYGLGDGRFFIDDQYPAMWDMSNLEYPRPQSYNSGQIFHTPVLGMASPGREYIRLLDMNGDGLLDYVVANPTGDPVYGDGSAAPWRVYLQKGPRGLLSEVKNELGGTTTIEYTPSTWLEHPIDPQKEEPGLPPEIIPDGRPRWVVTHIEVKDGRAGTVAETETGDYAGFRMNTELHEGSGVRLSESADAEGLVARSLMHQRPDLRGKLERQEKCQGEACFEQVDTTWTVVSEPVEGKSFLVRPTLTKSYTCDESNTAACNPTDATSSVQVHEVERDFDETTGELRQETDSGADGNLGAIADNLVRVIDYATNTDDWIVSLVSRERTYFGTASGTAVNDQQLFYDTAAASGNPEPSRCDGAVTTTCGGLVRFRKVLRDAAVQDTDPNKWATETWTYDDFGNMATYHDAVATETSGAPTQSVEYDDETHTFPVSIENGVGLETLLRFDAGLGEVTKVLSPGGYLRCFGFDDFGRLTSRSEGSALPAEIDGDPAALCGLTVASFDYPFDMGMPETQRFTETLNPYDSWNPGAETFQNLHYFDGLGREYQTETAHKTSDGSFDVVSRAWGSRGEQTCETLPFRRTGGIEGSVIAPCAAQTPRRETAYDLMLRPEKTVRVGSGGTPITETESTYLMNTWLTSSAGDLMVERRKTFGGPGAQGQSPTTPRFQYFGVDNSGQVLAVRDSSSSMLTRIERDPKGRITRIDGPDVPLISGSDGNLLELSYDARDLRTRLSQPMTSNGSGPTWTFQYDANGKLFEWTSPRNLKIRTYRDAMGRVVLTDYGANSSPSSPGPEDWVYTYHPQGSAGAGQLERVSGRNGIEDSFDYDGKGRLLAKTRDFQGSMQFAFGYGYDALDRPTYTVLPDTTGIYYRYDGAQLTTVGSQLALPQLPGFFSADVIASDIDSHPSGGLQNMTLSFPLWAPSQPPITSTYSYGDDQRLRSAVVERHPSGSSPERLQDLLYSYDTAGNLRRSEDLLPAPQLSQDFGYDAQHRLVSAVGSEQYGYGLHTYVYDDAGNLRAKGPITIDGQPLPGRRQLYYGRTAAQPTSVVRVDQQGPAGLVQSYGLYAYHEDGNASWRQAGNNQYLLERGVDGALEQVTFWGQGRDAFYLDDAQGLRAEKLVAGGPWWTQVEESRFLVDASYEVDTLNDRHEVHLFVGGRRVATSTRSGLGVYGPGTTSSVTSYHADPVGTNVLVVKTTSTSQLVSRSALEPFGKRTGGSLSGTPRYLFTDQERDWETNLDDFGARTYDALIGRFIEQDPELVGGGVTFARIAGDGANLNAYAYVLNRPTGMIDPTGLIPNFAIGIGLSFGPGSGPGMGPTGRFADGSEVRGWSQSSAWSFDDGVETLTITLQSHPSALEPPYEPSAETYGPEDLLIDALETAAGLKALGLATEAYGAWRAARAAVAAERVAAAAARAAAASRPALAAFRQLPRAQQALFQQLAKQVSAKGVTEAANLTIPAGLERSTIVHGLEVAREAVAVGADSAAGIQAERMRVLTALLSSRF